MGVFMPTQYPFSSIPFYTTHSYMEPFVGKNYESNRHKKLLLIGESFYVTQQSTNPQLNVKKWYEGSINVSPEDQGYCSPAATRNQTTGFGPVVKSSLELICSTNSDIWEEVAFYNYFLRPAKHRQGIQDLWKVTSPAERDIDRKMALENLLKVIDILKPDVFVMLSAFVCKKNAEHYYPIFYPHTPKEEFWDWTKSHGVQDYIYVNHPSRPCCWKKPMDAYWKFRDYKENKPKAEQLDYRACDFFEDWLTDKWM